MKLVNYILTPLLLALPASLQAQSSAIEIPESHSRISIHLSAKDADLDGYRSITISSDKRSTRIAPRNPVFCIPADKQDRLETGLLAEPKGMSLDRSRCFFRGTYTANGAPHTLLVFLSEGYASNAAPLLILGFHANGTPFKVLERNELDPLAFEFEPADGTARFIGAPTLSQVSYGDGFNGSTKPYATTYDPRAVYLIRPDAVAKYDLATSKAYNQPHYVWAGPSVSEQIAVIYNYPGHPKPFAVSDKRAQALFARLRRENQKP